MGDSGTGVDRSPAAKAFIQVAKQDLEESRSALEGGRYANACYHSEQASEKAVKAVLILEERFVEVHEVGGDLREIAEKNKWDIPELVEKAKELEKYWNVPRYPDPYDPDSWNPVEDITREDSEEALEKAEFILTEVKKILKEEYGVKIA